MSTQAPRRRGMGCAVALGVVFLIIIIGAIGKGNSNTGGSISGSGSTESSVSRACATPYPDKQEKDVCADADSTVNLNGVVVTTTPFTLTSDAFGGKSLCTGVTIRNTTTESQDYNEFNFKAQTPSGDVGSLSAQAMGQTLNSGTLVPGGTKTGKVCTADSGEQGQHVFIYKPSVWHADRGIWLFNR